MVEPASSARATAATGLRPTRTNNPLTGAAYLVRGLMMITRPGIRRYMLIPLALNVGLFALVIALGVDFIGATVNQMLPDWLNWLRWLLVPLFVLASLIGVFFIANVVANLICAPFNGLLAEAVEYELTGWRPADGGWPKLVRDLWVSLASAVRTALYLLVRSVPLLLLMLVPVLNVVASLAWLLFGAWMLAVAYADYPMANHGLSFTAQRPLLAQRRLLAIGFGAAVMAALAIPILNFVVIPAAVAGATLMWVEQYRSDDKDETLETPRIASTESPS